MIAANKSIFFGLLVSTAFAEHPGLRGGRERPYSPAPCAVFKSCYLCNKSSGKGVKLSKGDSYCPSDSKRGWSIRCETDYEAGGVTAMWNDEVMFDDPRGKKSQGPELFDVMNFYFVGVEDTNIDAGDYLMETGEKHFRVQGYQRSRLCFEESFTLSQTCSLPTPEFTPTEAPNVVEPEPTDACDDSKNRCQAGLFGFKDGVRMSKRWELFGKEYCSDKCVDESFANFKAEKLGFRCGSCDSAV